jgi:hypothetical protein
MERRIITTDDVSSDDDSEIFGEGFTLASREVKKRMMAAAASRVREGAPRASLTEAGPGVTCSASGGGPTHVDIKVRAAHRTLTPATCTPRSDALSRLLTATALTLSTAGAAADVDAAAAAADAAAADVAELAAAALRAAVVAAARSTLLSSRAGSAGESAAQPPRACMSGRGVCKDARSCGSVRARRVWRAPRGRRRSMVAGTHNARAPSDPGDHHHRHHAMRARRHWHPRSARGATPPGSVPRPACVLVTCMCHVSELHSKCSDRG